MLPFLTTFAQLSARVKNFLGGWILVLGIKEGLLECATVCIKSVVILMFSQDYLIVSRERGKYVQLIRMRYNHFSFSGEEAWIKAIEYSA